MTMRLDFEAVNRAALAQWESLLRTWLPHGRPEGGEWSATNPTRSDRHAGSFKVNLRSGAWKDFATGDAGGDPVSLYAYLHCPGDQGRAARELGTAVGVDLPPRGQVLALRPPAAAPVPPVAPVAAPAQRTPWVPLLPVPAHASPVPVAHPVRGRSDRMWLYRDAEGRVLGAVHRFTKSTGGKEIAPVVWARHAENGKEEWRWMHWAAPRPLYGLERLALHRARGGKVRVLVVEGEKCADAAHERLGELFAVLSWSGGGSAVGKADWTPVAGDDLEVTLFPDSDAKRVPVSKVAGAEDSDAERPLLPAEAQPGMRAMEEAAAILQAQGVASRIVVLPAPGVEPDGWDIADMVAGGADKASLLARIETTRAPACAPAVQQVPPPTSAAQAPKRKRGAGGGSGGAGRPPARADDGGGPPWHDLLLRRRGEVVSCASNVLLILGNSPEWEGVLSYDEFSMRTIKRRRAPFDDRDPESDEWGDVDDMRTAVWLARTWGMVVTSTTANEAVEMLARDHGVHPLRDYLRSLAWDGVRRIDTWLIDYLGVPDTPYARLVGRWFLMGMVRRPLQPGLKFDYCLVLEGAQGLRKSSALRVLGGEWFSDTELDLQSKDSLSAIRGKWLHEFGEMGSIARAESTRQKSFLSREVDEFRPVFGRREIRCPRQLVFAGTTNEWEWQKDPTGGRRFWPVEVRDAIDTEGLATVRDQLFAEALAAHRAQERYWPTGEEQRTIFDPEQLKREASDAFVDILEGWVKGQTSPFTLADAVETGLKLDAGRMTRDVMTRAGIALRKVGCRRVERRTSATRFWYEPPSMVSPAQPTSAEGAW